MQSNTHQNYHTYLSLICIGCGRNVDVPVYCGNRFCEVCGVPRALRIRRKLKTFLNSYQIPAKHSIRMLTFSIQNCTDLPEGVAELIRCFRRLRQRAYWKSHVLGGAFVIEIKGTPGNWHPHIHSAVCSTYLNWNTLHKMWNAVSGGLSVYISNVPQKSIVNYLLKYITKPSVGEFCLDDVKNVLKSNRLFQPFGDWHKPINKIQKHRYTCPVCGANHLEPYGTIDHTRSTVTKHVYTTSASRGIERAALPLFDS